MVTFFELGNFLETEENAFNYAVSKGLIGPVPTICEIDNYSMCLDKSKKYHGLYTIYRCCNKNDKRHRKNRMEGSIFENKNLEISKIIKILYFFSSSLTIYDIADQCGISEASIVSWFKDLRFYLENHIKIFDLTKIGGAGKIVEIDESHICSRKNGVGRVLSKEGIWVIGAICRETKEVAFQVSRRRNKRVINDFIMTHVNIGTTIITDGWGGYIDVNDLPYFHFSVNHSENFVDPDLPWVHTNNIERIWREVKKIIPDNCSEDGLQSYIYKFIFEKYYNVRKTSEKYDMLLNILRIN